MAYEQPGFAYTAKSVGDLLQFAAVKVTTGGAVTVAGATEAIDGIAQMPAAAANPESIRVMKTGISFAIAGGQVDAGSAVEVVGSVGKLVNKSGGAAVGKALTSAAAGEVFSVLLS